MRVAMLEWKVERCNTVPIEKGTETPRIGGAQLLEVLAPSVESVEICECWGSTKSTTAEWAPIVPHVLLD